MYNICNYILYNIIIYIYIYDKRISIKKEQISLYLVYNIVSLGKMGGKAEPFSWRSVEDELAIKYLENLDA